MASKLKEALLTLIERWRNDAEALKHYVGEQQRRSALNHCADELEEEITDAE